MISVQQCVWINCHEYVVLGQLLDLDLNYDV